MTESLFCVCDIQNVEKFVRDVGTVAKNLDVLYDHLVEKEQNGNKAAVQEILRKQQNQDSVVRISETFIQRGTGEIIKLI